MALALSSRGKYKLAFLITADGIQLHGITLSHYTLVSILKHRNSYNLYGADEFGSVTGEAQMQAEIFARGPIACSVNSDLPPFNAYR